MIRAIVNPPLSHRNWGLGAIALVVGLVILLPSCTQRLEAPEASPVEPGLPIQREAEVTIDNIIDNPTSFTGETVTVIGEVQLVVAPDAFALDDRDFAGNEYLLVTNATDTEQLKIGTIVQVTGRVEQFDRDRIDQKYNLDQLRPIPAFDDTMPVLLAETTQVVQVIN